MQAAVFLQDEATEHSVAERIAKLCAEHISNSPTSCNTSEDPKLDSTVASAATEPSSVDNTGKSYPWMTESILSDFTVGTDRRPKPPEGIISRVVQSPEPQLSGEISRKLYELDYSSPAAHTALEELPAPLRHLNPAALRTVLSCFPLHACTCLPAPLAFLSFESKLLTGMHARSIDASSACARRYNSLNLSDPDLQRGSLAFLLRYIPLLPPLTSLTISNSSCVLVGPFPRRWQRCNRDPPLPSVREALASWLVLHSTAREVAPTLTHLSLKNSSVERGVLIELCSALKSLVCLNLSGVCLTAPRGMCYTVHERADDVNRGLLRLPQLKRLALDGMISSMSIPLYVSHLTKLSVLDLSNRDYKWGGSNGAINLHLRLMSQLSEVTTLVDLDLSGNPICCNSGHNATQQRVHDSEVFRALFAGLAKLTALRHLGLARTRVLRGLLRDPVEGAYSPLSRMTSLTSLDISDAYDSEEGELCDGQCQGLAKVLGKLLCLKELKVARSGLTLQTAAGLLGQLAGLPCLEVLSLEGNDLAVAKKHQGRAAGVLCSMIQSVQCMPCVRVLNLRSCKLSMGAPHVARIAHEYIRLNGRSAVLHTADRPLELQDQVKSECPAEEHLSTVPVTETVPLSSKLAVLVRETGLMPCIEVLDLSDNGLKESEVADALNRFLRGSTSGTYSPWDIAREMQVSAEEKNIVGTGALRVAHELVEDTDSEDEPDTQSCFGQVLKPILVNMCVVWLVIWSAFVR